MVRAASLDEMTIVIVGAGKIGAHHAAAFRQAGHLVSTVDRRGDADWDRVAQVPEPSSVDAWVVATPTATHLSVICEILRRQPDARILLEKPACYPAELTELVRTIRRYPRARIIVNDVYSYSDAVRRFAESVREHSEFDPIRKITVEFTKNRELDVANGRFVDTQYGEAGYEGFHMLSILRAILPADAYQSYLYTVPVSVTAEMRVRTLAANLPEIELYTSSSGAIAFADLAGFAFSADVVNDYIASSTVPYGVDLRYRFADVELDSGKHVTLVFEPFFGLEADYKNMHAVYVRGGGDVRGAAPRPQFVVSGNHFKEALLTQLNLLHQVEEGTTVIRPSEHRFLAALGWAVSTGSFPRLTGADQYVDLRGNNEKLAQLGSEA
jgi:predicted dehydrogenase